MTLPSFRILLAALCAPGVALAQSGAPPERPLDPPAGVYRSEVEAVRFAVDKVCLPAVGTGRAFSELFRPGLLMRGRSRDPARAYVQSFVWVDSARGACTVTAASGDAPALREAVLAALEPHASNRVTPTDTGAGSRDSNGDFRQELHCMSVDGQPMFLLMSSSSASNRNRLMASFGSDRDGSCSRRAAAGS